MSASNKLIFSLAQNLDIDEKNQARKNIGAVGCFGQSYQTATHTITNDEAQHGGFDVTLTHNSPGRYLLKINVYSGTNDGLQSDRYPLRLSAIQNYSGGGQSSVELGTTALERLDSPGPWYANATMILPNTFNATSIVLHLYFGMHKIPANAVLTVTIDYHLLSETDPS